MAVDGAKGSVSFLDNLPNHPKVQAEVKDAGALRAAVAKAKSAMNDFTAFLESDLLPRSHGVYAVGAEHYNLLLKKKHFLAHDDRSLLSLGEALFEKTKNDLAELAEELAPGKDIEEVARRIQEYHPAIDEVLAVYQKAMEAARDFVREKKLASFPPKEELHVVYTRDFRRHEIPFAAYLSPSPNIETHRGASTRRCANRVRTPALNVSRAIRDLVEGFGEGTEGLEALISAKVLPPRAVKPAMPNCSSPPPADAWCEACGGKSWWSYRSMSGGGAVTASRRRRRRPSPSRSSRMSATAARRHRGFHCRHRSMSTSCWSMMASSSRRRSSRPRSHRSMRGVARPLASR